MKRIISLFLFIVVVGLQANAQADIYLEEMSYDFGKVKEGNDTLWHSFIIKNTGTVPLEIKDVKTSCDCTLAQWPSTPIAPGKTAVIKGGFKIEGKKGEFEKNIIIMANTSPAVTIITIKGNIVVETTSP
ncbi:MAG: DUF1573 domain-containing protein [Cytophagaceae bacterium]